MNAQRKASRAATAMAGMACLLAVTGCGQTQVIRETVVVVATATAVAPATIPPATTTTQPAATSTPVLPTVAPQATATIAEPAIAPTQAPAATEAPTQAPTQARRRLKRRLQAPTQATCATRLSRLRPRNPLPSRRFSPSRGAICRCCRAHHFCQPMASSSPSNSIQ